MKNNNDRNLPLGPLALILSKHYYGVLSKSLEKLDVDRYYSVLYYLSENNGCCQQQICNALAIDKTAMVKVMDYLIRAGFVERTVNLKDRREHFISLSKKGRRQTALVVQAFNMIDSEVFSGISKSERQTFFSVVERLSDKLKDLPSNDLFFNYKKTRAQMPGRKTNDKKRKE